MNERVGEIVAALRQSRKYRSVCESTLTRIAAWSLRRYPKSKDAVKMAKNKLHQVYGAYVEQLDVPELETRMEGAADDAALRNLCREVMSRHASSAERLDHIARFHSGVFDVTGAPASILDLACGLHPFAIPWMDLPRTTRYHAVDIDTRLTALHNRLLRRLGMEEAARCDDIFTMDLSMPVDMVFLLKTLPCLDQQETGASRSVLNRLNATWIVASFLTQTLGGRSKGMGQHYAAQYEPALHERGTIVTTLEFGNERVYVVKSQAR